MIEPRPYQTSAMQSVFDYFDHNTGNPLIVLPTGTGKSIVLGLFVKQAMHWFPDTRILLTTHVQELVEQDVAALQAVWPEAPFGIFSAGLGRKDSFDNPITFCGIQSVYRRAHEMGRIDLLLIDEAHLLGRRSGSMYGRFITELRRYCPALKVVGFTATPYRLDSGLLTEGKDRLFTDICYEAPILDMIKLEWLAPVTSKATETKLDVSGVSTVAGDYKKDELERAVDLDPITRAAVAEIVRKGADRKFWLIFCAGIKHARHVMEEINRHGIRCAMVTGETPGEVRKSILGQFKAGEIRAVCNVGVLTTGFDHPGLDLIALMRPTKSTGLYVQMVGRGTRTAPGKENCLVLDFGGNVARHGPIDSVNPKGPGEGGGEAPTKICPSCGEILHASVRVCTNCGHAFPPPDIKITPTASVVPILSQELRKPVWLPVQRLSFSRHTKPNSPPSLRVTYHVGLSAYSRWVCFEHDGYARQKAAEWWQQHGGGPVPATVNEALERALQLRWPAEISVRSTGKFFEVTAERFAPVMEPAA